MLRNALPTQGEILRTVYTGIALIFCLQFTAKSLNRQAKKAQKDENSEKARLKKVRNAFCLEKSCANTIY